MVARHYHSTQELPRDIPVFPLSGVLLLPGGQLPLNIFEPRYLTMFDTALAGPRLVGMIQPQVVEEPNPPLMTVGCLGRISAFAETDDGRYLVTLTGICRFRVEQENPVLTPYRQVRADYAPFGQDLILGEEYDIPRSRVITALKHYVKRRQIKAEWGAVTDAPAQTLVNALAMLCPFEPNEKQALLEAPRFQDRVETLIALLELSGAQGSESKRLN